MANNKTVMAELSPEGVKEMESDIRQCAMEFMNDQFRAPVTKGELNAIVFGFRTFALHMLATELYNGIAQLGWDTKGYLDNLVSDMRKELEIMADETTGNIKYTPASEDENDGPKQ